MNTTSEMIFVDQTPSDQEITNGSYWNYFKDTGYMFDITDQDRTRIVSELVYEIQKHPRDLKAHIQRIYYCYRENLTDPLYAALVDFLIILNKRGKHISRRMIAGSAAKLSARQRALLKAATTDETGDISLIEGNSYSIFCRGLSGSVNLVDKSSPTGSSSIHDPLQLAEDAVEYCQLDEAMDILESAITEYPERTELHDYLLELYKSTQNRARFEQSFARLRNQESFLTDQCIPDGWMQMQNYFELKYC